jgi:hypothetical protein
MSDPATPNEDDAQPRADAGKPDARSDPQDPLKVLLAEMKAAANTLGPRDAEIQNAVERLITQVDDAQRLQQPGFRTGVAYVLQDLEKAVRRTFAMPPDLATEMRQSALSSPGLSNPRMATLLQATPTIDDRGLIRDIRQAAKGISREGSHQDTPQIRAQLDVLEHRARLSRAPSVATPRMGQSDKTAPEPTRLSTAAASPANESGQPGNAATGSAGMTADRPVFRPQPAPADPRSTQGGVVRDILRAGRMPVPSQIERFAPPAAPVGVRISQFEQRLAESRTHQLIQAAERSGVQAIEAAEQFIIGPGRGILGKIEAAASTESGGMQAVLSEMRSGGRYADLRTEFDGAYQQDRNFAGAYDKMVENAARFGKDRMAVNSNYASRGLDISQLDGRFQRAEEALGEAAAKTPGRIPGNSALDEMGEKLTELLRSAAEKVRTFFDKEVGAAANQQARPSPSMSM